MIIPIHSFSALEFWTSGLSNSRAERFSIAHREMISLPRNYSLTYQQEFYKDLSVQYGLSLPIFVLADKSSARKWTDYMYCTKRPNSLPAHSFVQLDESVYVCSPELCLVQLANKLPFPKLVEAANLLCAIFSSYEDSLYRQISREPITNGKSIQQFLNKAKSIDGIKKARQAEAYLLERANSPMEGKLAVPVMLPISLGGFALPKPVLNFDVQLSKESALYLGRESCCCDMVWPAQKVIVEYDSNLTHLTPDQHAYDKHKATALNMSGYQVFTITADNVRSVRHIEETFITLRKQLGLRANKAAFDKFRERRYEALRSVFFSSFKDELNHEIQRRI